MVCAVMEDADGRILACRRSSGGHLGGLWEFPGGKVEAGEELAVALVRELQEELGVLVGVGEPLTPVTWDYGRGPFRLLPFFCTVLQGIPTPLEHSELRWCDRSEAERLTWAAADVPILRELIKQRGFR